METEEVWQFLPWTLKYSVSTHGRVRNDETGEFMKIEVGETGRAVVRLRYYGRQHHHGLARLVGQTFLPNPDGLPQVHRIDRSKSDYSVSNLQWGKKGKPMGAKDKRPRKARAVGSQASVPVRDVLTDTVYPNARLAAIGVFGDETAKSSIRNVCRGDQKTSRGRQFEWVE